MAERKTSTLFLNFGTLELLIHTAYALMCQGRKEITVMSNGKVLATVTLAEPDLDKGKLTGSSFLADFGRGRVLEYTLVRYGEGEVVH